MKNIIFIAAMSLLFGGCYSFVRTYDNNGNLLGECNSGHMLFGFIQLAAFGGCSGSANPSMQGKADSSKSVTPADAVIPHPDEHPLNCPPGQVSQYGSCYPLNPIVGGAKK